MLPYLRLGPLLLQTPGLAILVGLWLGMTAAEKEAKRTHLNPAHIYNFLLVGLLSGIVGARLAYASQYLSIYLENPLSLFALNLNTLAPFEGFLIGLAAAGLYLARRKLPLRPVLDTLTPGLAIFFVALGVSHILSGQAYGMETQVPWSIFLWGEYRHPTQFYETLAALLILVVIWLRPLRSPGAGLNFLLFVSLTALARIFTEAFRADSSIIGDFRSAQVAGLVILALSLLLLHRWMKSPTPYVPESVVTEEDPPPGETDSPDRGPSLQDSVERNL
ncbi:MAG: prolipoprotein diacylglyceryl transferase [Chloroflexi bacterium]|nr:MAG: prolipoprotein diacylglyceryl transferase [Chloroflexota bacterium]